MKPRLALSLASTLMVAPLQTGCLCTSPIMEQLNERTVDTFNPSAVYRKPNPNGFALEGTRNGKSGKSHAFFIIPDHILADAKLQTNENLSMEDIQKLYGTRFEPQRTSRNVPPHYERVAVLPKNDISIGIEEHYGAGGWLVILLPGAFVVDVVTFPFQAIYVVSHNKLHM